MNRILSLKYAIGIVWQNALAWSILDGIILIIQSTLPILVLYLTKEVVDLVAAGFLSANKKAAFEDVLMAIAMLGAATLFTTLLTLASSLIYEAKNHKISRHIEHVLLSKSVKIDLEYYESSQYYDTLHRAQKEAPYRTGQIVSSLFKFLQSVLTLLALIGLLFSVHWMASLVLFAIAIPGFLCRLWYANQIYHWQKKQTPLERKMGYFQWLLTNGTSAKEIRLLGLGDFFIHRLMELRHTVYKEKLNLSLRHSIINMIVQSSSVLAILGSYTVVAYNTVQGNLSIGDMIMYYQALQRGQGYLQNAFQSLSLVYEDSLFLSNFYEFIDLKSKIQDPENPVAIPSPLSQGIRFERVGFQYPGNSCKTLQDIEIHIPAGQMVAFVGENGSGKTTLAKILCRLYEPMEGAVLLDGIDIRNFSLKDLRNQIGVIFQDYIQYHATARENVWFGNIGVSSQDKKILLSTRISGAHEVISGLPEQYETMLGKWFENGKELSMGQWQKIALARAFMKDSQILVLDEPNSSMDAQAEYEFFKEFRAVAKGKTAILISHRFSSVRLADYIYVLDKGRIIEQGNHEDLIAQNGKYAYLFHLQAQNYR